MARESRERQESPSRIAVRNLEESWRRFELDSGPSSPSLVSSSTTFVGSSPLSPRPSSSPSPLSRPPYRELIECTSFKDTKISTPAAENESVPGGGGVSAAGEGGGGEGSAASARGGKSAVLKSESSNKTNNTTHDNDHRIDNGRRRTTSTAATVATPSKTTATTAPAAASSTLLSSSSPTPISSTTANKGTSAATATPLEDSIEIQQQQHHQEQVQNAFLTSKEARHILDLPSLLGQEPDRISQVLAMPIPLQPKARSSRPSSLASTGNGESSSSTAQNNTEENNDGTSGSALISKLNAKAETTAEAMTKRYAAKNLNMTETEAHRMVQVMAAEIVALHEERVAMVKKMEQAKQEMLEAARLLRMKAAEAEAPEELQDMSAEGRRRRSLASGSGIRLSVHDDNETTRTRKETESSEDERQRSMYDRDEWRERE